MIDNVLREIKNYFIVSQTSGSSFFANGVVVSNPSIFTVKQFVLVIGSALNNGVYQITSIDLVNRKIHFGKDDDIGSETVNCYVYGLAIPKALISLIGDIAEYDNANKTNIASESIGDYSVSYTTGSANETSWVSVFRKRLDPYRKMFLTIQPSDLNSWQT
jgi:hypothetical protein